MEQSLSLESRMKRYRKALIKILKINPAWKMRLAARRALAREDSYENYFYDLLKKMPNIAKRSKDGIRFCVNGIKFEFFGTCVYFAQDGETLGHVDYDERGIRHIIKTSIETDVADDLIIKLEEITKSSVQ